MNRTATLTAGPLLAASLLLTGCSGASTTTSTGTSTATARATASAAATSAPAPACPTEATQKLAKTRFVVNVGLALGAAKQWITDPMQEGAFAAGAEGRTAALAKAAIAGAFAAKQAKDAYANVQADPTLCNAILGPMSTVSDRLSDLVAKIKAGDLSSIAATTASIEELMNVGKAAGLSITPNESVTIPGL